MSTERLFQTHEIRRQTDLNGMWQFQTLEEPVLPERYTDTMSVPSCWEMTLPYCRYRGLAAYKKEIHTDRQGNLRFLFKGISHTGTVYLDGQRIGSHYNAYTPFSAIASNVPAGEHTLEVLVDNRFTEGSKLHIPNDYFTYGGITRNAFMEIVPDCFIERMEFEPDLREGKWSARIRVYVRNLSAHSKSVNVRLSCAGCDGAVQGTAFANQITEMALSMEFYAAQAWSHESPSLYYLKAALWVDDERADDLIERVGFRTVRRQGSRIAINGDIKLIRDIGANAVRTCHYPNDELFLDLCDENGIFVWEESHDRGGDEKRITDPEFVRQSMEVMHEMLETHYNHPSIIIWGCLNEAASDCEKGSEVYRTHLEYLASDRSRLCTFASNKTEGDLCLGMEDICSFNMYPCWYNDETAEEAMKRIRTRIKETGNDGKPIIVSEFGGGAIYNFHDVMRVKWSEEYQADLLKLVTAQLLEQEDVTGIFVWQFCDVRVSQEGERNWPMTRPLSRNNKGIVDEFRRPKLAYYALRDIFRQDGR